MRRATGGLFSLSRDEIADGGGLRPDIVNCAPAVGASCDIESSWKWRLFKQI
jgi:hypothetical protein